MHDLLEKEVQGLQPCLTEVEYQVEWVISIP
jgi:hypothetical protein